MLRDYRSGPAGISPAMGNSSPANAAGKQTLTQSLPPISPGADQGDPRLRQVEKYSAFIDEAAAKYGMDATHLKAIMAVESGGNPNASSGSAFGLMQITRETWEGTRKRDPDLGEYEFEANWRNPRINTLFGAAVLKSKARAMGVTPDDENFATLAVIAYNAGEGTVKFALNHAKAAGSKDPEQDFLKPEHLKPAIERYGLYSYYLTNATGKKRNKSGTKEEAIELKYREIINYVPQVEGYLEKLGAGKSTEGTKDEDAQSADGTTPIGDRDSSSTSRPDPDGPDAAAPEQGNAPAPEQDAGPTSAPGQGPSAERTYQVRSGDTLTAIARRLLGSSERWREIAQLNGVTDPRTLRVGQTLRIPGTAAGAGAGPGPAADRSAASAGEGPAPASQLAVVEYRVRAGDTLAEIAERLLGSAARWQEIARANGITDPRTLRIGQVLRVPGGSAQTGGGGAQQSDGSRQDGGAQQDGGDGGGTGAKPAWISVAEAEIGTQEIAGNRHNPRVLEYHATTGRFSNDETPWCASFVNWVLTQAGQSGTGSAMAMSFKNYGTKLERPAYGSIAVLSYGGGKGHVGFVVGRQGNRVLLLGGNQSNGVNVKAFGTGQIVAYVVPPGHTVPASAFQLDANGPRAEDGGGVGDTR